MPDERQLVHAGPWLELRPLFYNVRTGVADHDVFAVIDWPNLEFDLEGLADYLDLGYSAFGKTPIRDVFFVQAHHALWRMPDGRLHCEARPDDMALPEAGSSTPEHCLELMRSNVLRSVADGERTIVVPTSGGKDSRILTTFLCEAGLARRVRSFTYGTSDVQERSEEVVRAREVARRCGILWERVPLGGFLAYLDEWYALFGPAVSAHGMYHIEFYRLIRERLALPPLACADRSDDQLRDAPLVLSGAIGDWFAGILRTSPTLAAPWRSPADVIPFLRQGPEHATSAALRVRPRRERVCEYFETHRQLAEEKRLRYLEKARVRSMLLRYLVDVPRALGFDAKAPLADREAAAEMLSLPTEQRREHRWQREFFARRGLDVDAVSTGDGRNTLDFQALRRVPLQPLSESLLAEYVRPDYVRWVNRNIGRLGTLGELYWRMRWVKGLRRANAWLERRGCRSQRLPAYHAYQALWPLQRTLELRAAAQRGDMPTPARRPEAGRE